jgi:hypothetical protein
MRLREIMMCVDEIMMKPDEDRRAAVLFALA